MLVASGQLTNQRQHSKPAALGQPLHLNHRQYSAHETLHQITACSVRGKGQRCSGGERVEATSPQGNDLNIDSELSPPWLWSDHCVELWEIQTSTALGAYLHSSSLYHDPIRVTRPDGEEDNSKSIAID